MTVQQIAAGRYRRMAKLARRTAAEVAKLWRRVTPERLDLTWVAPATDALRVITAAQLTAAGEADTYVAATLLSQHIDPAAAGKIVPQAFAGIASDGRSLLDLLGEAPIVAKATIIRGGDTDRAMTAGAVWLDMAVRTQVADAGRAAEGAAITARAAVGGYVRMLEPPSCSRCVILAGSWYRWNAGFERHPRCLPAGVVVSGPATLAATRRRFQGELVVITTASGQQLPVTGNHPVLTERGWLPAHLVQEGDEVVRSTRGQGATALVVPDEDQVPTRIEDLWRPDGMVPFDHVPTTTEDFHGDGGHGEVDVVLADRLLRYGFDSALCEFAEQEQLAWGIAQAFALAQVSTTQQQVRRLWSSAYRFVRGGSLCPSLVGSLPASADPAGDRHAPNLDASGFQTATYGRPRDAVPAAQAVLAFAGAIRRSEVVGRQFTLAPRWDPPAGPLTMQSRGAYAQRGQDLLLRLAGQVELDRVVEVRRVEWSGHVYNLTSVEGWYSANGLIVSNCDCRHIPAAEDAAGALATDPRRYFDSLPAEEQDRAFTRSGAQAIRDGADLAQVVNARRGMKAAGGRLTTTESTTRRGRAAKGRLMPEQIYRDAVGDRDEAIRLLKQHGYLT